MKRIAAALTVALALAACGGKQEDGAKKKEELRELDPNPPMSASDIDSIVKETRERDARGGGAPAQPAESAPGNTN